MRPPSGAAALCGFTLRLSHMLLPKNRFHDAGAQELQGEGGIVMTVPLIKNRCTDEKEVTVLF